MCAILPEVYQFVGVPEGDKLPSFSSIGCYTIIYLTKQGEVLCGKCATKHNDEDNQVVQARTYDEGDDLACDGVCGKMIESSYGKVDDNVG